jgi:hypothetical protein
MGQGKGGKMTQTLCAHMNLKKKEFSQKFNKIKKMANQKKKTLN